MLSPMFTGSKMRKMFSLIASVGQKSTATIKKQIKQESSKVFELKDLTTRFTVDIIANCAFGIEVNSFENPDNGFYKMAMNISNFGNILTLIKFIGFMMVPWFMRLFKIKFFCHKVYQFFHETILETMRIRDEKGIIRHDVINLLMQARKEQMSKESLVGKSDTEMGLDFEDFAAQAFNFFSSGFETVRQR